MTKKKVLVVDDEVDFLKVITARLQAQDYEVTTAATGEEALKKIKAEEPNVVLLDIQMPEMDGLEVLKRIRRQNKTLPVFMLTAVTDPQKFEEAQKLQSSGFIFKTSNLRREIQNITAILHVSDKYRTSASVNE